MTSANKPSVFYRTLALSSLALMFGGLLLWYVNRPHYLKFSTEAVGKSHIALELVYPADWAPARLLGTYDWDFATVILQHRPPTGLQKWMEEGIYHIGSQDWKNATIRVQLISGSGQQSPDINLEEQRLRGALKQLARTGNEYSLRRVNFASGPAIVFDIKSTGAVRTTGLNRYNCIILFPDSRPGQARTEVVVSYIVPERLKDRVRKTAFEIIEHVRLVEKK